ncbi:MAG TPA: HepT-like ribonuclease domain-containing protein [Candidatus Krumholzibacteria bacterium]|jgi:uncharacterized protein with HEPN domain
MRREERKYLHDMQQAAGLIAAFTQGKRFEDYERDVFLRSAVERQFEIVGEALSQLSKINEALADRMSEHRRIIAFRNILAHGYTEVHHHVVWDVVENKLPILRAELETLLAEA